MNKSSQPRVRALPTIARRLSIQAAIVAILLTAGNIAVYLGYEPAAWRQASFQAVPAISIVLALLGAIVLALMANSVLTLRSESFAQARRVRRAARDLQTALSKDSTLSPHPIWSKYVGEIVLTPLDDLRDWAFAWDYGQQAEAQRLVASENEEVLWGMADLDDEIQELRILTIRRISTVLTRRMATNTIGIVAAGLVLLALDALAPSRVVVDMLLANLATALLILAPLYLLVAGSYLDQEAREHGYETGEEDLDSAGAST